MENEVLKVAYYTAKWNHVGIPNEFEVESSISKIFDLSAFKSLKKEIRHNIYKKDKSRLEGSKQGLKSMSDNNNKTMTQLRVEVNEILNNLM